MFQKHVEIIIFMISKQYFTSIHMPNFDGTYFHFQWLLTRVMLPTDTSRILMLMVDKPMANMLPRVISPMHQKLIIKCLVNIITYNKHNSLKHVS